MRPALAPTDLMLKYKKILNKMFCSH